MYFKVAKANGQNTCLGGQLPGTALLHIKQLSLLGMIARIPDSVLRRYARHIITTGRPSASSWFQQIQDLCILYQIPHPITTLKKPPKKGAFNRLVKSHISDQTPLNVPWISVCFCTVKHWKRLVRNY